MSALVKRAPSRAGWLRILGTLITLALVVYLLSQQGWAEIKAALQQIATWRLIAALGLILFSRLAVCARWHVLLRSAELDISFGQSTRITFAGLFANNFLPTTIGGDVFRLAGAARLKYDPAVCAASLIADRLVGITGMLMAVPWGLQGIRQAGALHPGSFPSLAATLTSGAWGRKVWDKILELSTRTLKTLSIWLKRPRALLISLGYSWVHMLCFFGAFTLLLHGMGETTSFWRAGGLYSLVYLVTLLPISINGYGVQELSMTLVFSRLGGVSLDNALTLALVFRTLLMIASLPGAATLPGILAGASSTPTMAEQ